MSLSIIFDSMLFATMWARVTSKDISLPALSTTIFTFVPSSPFMLSDIFVIFSFVTIVSSTCIITSPALIPAFFAGVSGITPITFSFPSFTLQDMCTPMPLYSSDDERVSSWYSSAVKYLVYGSSILDKMPSIAPSVNSSMSSSPIYLLCNNDKTS